MRILHISAAFDSRNQSQVNQTPERPQRPLDRVVHVTTFSDPNGDMDKLQDLYESLVEARREVGQEPVPFHKFAELIRAQVDAFRQKGSREVAFRVAMKEGKVAFTARAMRGGAEVEKWKSGEVEK